MIIGAIEAGGTKFVCAIGNEQGTILERITFPTESPKTTIEKIINFFKDKNIEQLGIGSFGPIDLNSNSKTYGFITETPKPLWQNFNFIGELKNKINVPIKFDTDVNVAALGEMTWGSAQGIDDCLYITIGTGIGGGGIVSNNLIHGMLHPEMGHILLRRHSKDNYIGKCPFHNDCFEGLASGPAIEERWGMKAIELPKDHIAWELEAYYVAQAVVNYILILSPKKIILGGGVMKQKHLFPLIHKNVKNMLNGYIQTSEIISEIENYIIPPKLGDNAGILGAIALVLKNNH